MIPAAELGPDHLVLSFFSIRHATFEQRLEVAAAAGFEAVGMLVHQYGQLVHDEGRDPRELRELADRHGLAVVELEAVRGWSTATPAGSPHHQVIDWAMEMADVFGSRHLTAVGAFDGELADAAAGFGLLCDRAADHGLRVGLEPMPIYDVPDIATGREIVERAARPNGGLCVDSWHLTRGGQRWDQLESLPGDLVASIQIDDGTIAPEHDDYLEDTLANRRLCGDGEFDLDRYVRTLDAIGADSPYSVEVISAELDRLPFDEAARRLADTTRAAIAAARS